MIDLGAIIAEACASGDYSRLVAAIPYARFLGLCVRIIEGRVRVCVPFQPMLIGNATLPSLHGGVVGGCLETAAILQLLHEQGGLPMPKTIDFTVDYLRKAGPEELFIEADVQRSGRRVANVRMRAFQQDAALPVALGRGNFLLD